MLRGLHSCLKQVGPRVYPTCFSTQSSSKVPPSTPEDEKGLIFKATKGSAIDKVIKRHGVYVDMTKWVYNILTSEIPKMYYCGPKRLGKSTPFGLIEDLCKDNAEDLFKGTEIAETDFFTKHWLKNKGKSDYPYVCLRFDFSGLPANDPEKLKNALLKKIQKAANPHNIKVPIDAGVGACIEQLTTDLSEQQHKQVVMLIDEVDSPYYNIDTKFQRQYKQILNEFYAPLKMSNDIRLLLLTGTLNRLSEMGNASNDTQDITIHPTLHPALGFTEEQVRKLFPNKLLYEFGFKDDKDQEAFRKKLKRYYNGYVLADQPNLSVYNPYSVLMCRTNKGKIQTYWGHDAVMEEMKAFVSQFPSHIDEKTTVTLERNTATVDGIRLSDVSSIAVRMLWNYGIFTVKESKGNCITLIPSNQEAIEVYGAMLRNYAYLTDANRQLFAAFNDHALAQNLNGMKEALIAVLPSGMLNWRKESDLDAFLFQGFKAQNMSVFYNEALGIANVEPVRAELLILYPQTTYVFELKFNSTVTKAMNEIKDRRHCEELVRDGKRVFAVALNYDVIKGLYLLIAEVKKKADGHFEYEEMISA